MRMQKTVWFLGGMLSGLTALTITRASVPVTGNVTDDTALYQRLSEIHVKKEAKIDFDSDINNLAQVENRYQERLPSITQQRRLKKPIHRVAQQNYRSNGHTKNNRLHQR